MKYLFTNVVGSFVLDDQLEIIDSLPFANMQEYEHKENTEQKLKKRHPQLTPLPLDKLPKVLLQFKDPQYYNAFYAPNLALTKAAIKQSVTEDIFVMQTIANINELDKTINLLSKRVREWCGWYAPEVVARISDHEKLMELIGGRSRTELLKELKESDTMGADIPKVHVDEILLLARQVRELFRLREQHETYLQKVMQKYCPNVMELAGVTLGAKLIELGKGLKHLALLPASTIQLLGAEKALFRHIKTGARSPKHGIIINHPLIQNAAKTSKGKAARMLADKISLCARLDYFKGEFKAKEYRKELEGKLKEDHSSLKSGNNP